MCHILLILQKKHFSKDETLEKIADICSKLNKQQIIDTRVSLNKKKSQLQYTYNDICKRISKLIYIYDISNTESSEIPKLIRDTIEEYKRELKIVHNLMNDIKMYYVLMSDLLLIDIVNEYSFVDVKIDKVKHIKDNFKNFNNSSIDRFTITIRNFIDIHLSTSLKHLFPPKITSILGRTFYPHELVENHNYCLIRRKEYSVRSYDLSLLVKIAEQISRMITYLKIDLFNAVYSNNYLKYYRIFLLKQLNILLPTDIIRYIFEFIGGTESEQLQPNVNDTLYLGNLTFLKNRLREIRN